MKDIEICPFWCILQAEHSPDIIFIVYTVCWLKVKGLDTCCSAAYTSETQRFTISEVPADWHELIIRQRIIKASTARDNGQMDPRCS